MALDIRGKIAFVTGASSGIGKETARQLASQGAHVILTARRLDRIEALADAIESEFGVRALPVKLDVTQHDDVESVVQGLPSDWQAIDILVNNAGLALDTVPLQEGIPEHWSTMIDTNIKGLLYVTRAILPSMVERDTGHVINVGSMAGHEYYATGNVYIATKHAVKALSYSLRIDLLGKAIRVTNISPGAVHTEFSEVRWQDKAKSDAFYEGFEPLRAEDIADTIVYAATRPKHVNVSEIKVLPTAQASMNHLSKTGGSGKGLFD